MFDVRVEPDEQSFITLIKRLETLLWKIAESVGNAQMSSGLKKFAAGLMENSDFIGIGVSTLTFGNDGDDGVG